MSVDLISIDIYPDIAFEEDLTPNCGVEIDDIVEQIHSACEGWCKVFFFKFAWILESSFPQELNASNSQTAILYVFVKK